MIKLNNLKKDNKERYERNMPHFLIELAAVQKYVDFITKNIENWEQLGYVDREENSPSAETAPALRTPLISDKLENAMNLPSPEDIKEREIDMKFDLLEALKKFLANKNCKPPLETKTIYPRKDPDGDAGACPIKLSTEEDIKERDKSMIEEFNNDPELNKMEKDIMEKIRHWEHSGYESQFKKAPNLAKLAESSQSIAKTEDQEPTAIESSNQKIKNR